MSKLGKLYGHFAAATGTLIVIQLSTGLFGLRIKPSGWGAVLVLIACAGYAARMTFGPARVRIAGTLEAPKLKRFRRAAEVPNATAQKFLSYVKSNDGKRLEEISKGIGIAASELMKPAQMLLAAKAVKRTCDRAQAAA